MSTATRLATYIVESASGYVDGEWLDTAKISDYYDDGDIKMVNLAIQTLMLDNRIAFHPKDKNLIKVRKIAETQMTDGELVTSF